MPNVLRSQHRPGEFILSESNNNRSRDNAIVLAGNVVRSGQPCGKVTASGKIVPLNPAGTNGSEDFYGVPVFDYDATAGDLMGAFITNDAELIGDGIAWPEGISPTDKAAAVAQMLDKGIKIRPPSYVG